ncbi:MAG: hypothetical protein ACRC0V_12905 [Fusobacteriaceae bacterium]
MFEKKEDKKFDFNIKMNLEDMKKLLTYFNDEFLENFDEFLETLEKTTNDNNEEYEYYGEVRSIIEDMVYELHKEQRKKERMVAKNSYTDEVEKIMEKLNPYSKEIIKKILVEDENIDEGILIKLYWYLNNSFDKSGQLVFAQNSLENLLELEHHKLERFLNQLSKIEVQVGERKFKFIEGYNFLNSTTIKLNYCTQMINPLITFNNLENITAEKILK